MINKIKDKKLKIEIEKLSEKTIYEIFRIFYGINFNYENIKENNEFSVRTAHILVVIQEALQNYIEKYANNEALTKTQRINSFQSSIKGSLYNAICEIALNQEQRSIMQKTHVLDETYQYIMPELQSLDPSNKKINESFIEIFNNHHAFINGYFDYVIKQTKKTSLTLFTGSDIKLSYKDSKFWKNDKEEIYNLIEFINQENCLVANGSISFIVFSFGMIHQLGSERNYRKYFIDYLEQNIDKFTSEQQKHLERLIEINKSLICPDYNSKIKNREHIGLPIATDGANFGSYNPAEILSESGENIRDFFQEIIKYPMN